MKSSLAVIVAAAWQLLAVEGFAGVTVTGRSSLALNGSKEDGNFPKKKGFFAGFFEELDAFVDDATNRRLGAGSAFYGKRKSNFYGNQDKNRKRDRDVFDPTEDYQGPAQAGYFKWMPDEMGEMRPVTRMKEKIVERRNPYRDD